METVAPSWAYSLHLPHDPRAPGIARATLRTVLAAHDRAELTPTAELPVSELVTNANLHTTGPYALRLMALEPRRLRIRVWDTDPRIPDGFTLRVVQGARRLPWTPWADAACTSCGPVRTPRARRRPVSARCCGRSAGEYGRSLDRVITR